MREGEAQKKARWRRVAYYLAFFGASPDRLTDEHLASCVQQLMIADNYPNYLIQPEDCNDSITLVHPTSAGWTSVIGGQ